MHPFPTRPRARGLIAALLLAAACTRSGDRASVVQAGATLPDPEGRLFSLLPSSVTGVRFENRLHETRDLNVFTYRNFYNGGGVAIGDLTGDGLPELVLTSNEEGPKVYLNEGNFHFRDITAAAGLASIQRPWTTGVTLADVNGDGKLDIYICRAGPGAPATRANELWINQGLDAKGIPTFREVAKQYGVADEGWSTQAAFVDYDHDGDLDLFVIDNSPRPASSFEVRNTRGVRDPYGGAKLYRNDAPKGAEPRFVEVGAEAGIHSPEFAFGLGLVVADVNRDGWPDIYVSNDFFERDYLYINQHDGTFRDVLDQATSYSSYFSMGLDIADVDDDGLPDIYTTDMLPEDEYRLKTTTLFESWEVYQAKVRNGFHYQLMRNMLQRNNGPSPDGSGITFTEIGQMAGVARTDWSWSALIADLDLDGRKDIVVTNGLARDITAQDYVAFLGNPQTMREVTAGGKGKVDFDRLTRAMKSTPLANYAFHNVGTADAPRFVNEAAAWGLATPSFSSGAAYGDLDGDGALDLVVNNVNQEAFVYRNNARRLHPERRWLAVKLEGDPRGANRFGLGAQVTVFDGGVTRYQELSPTRGFQSSVDYVLSFGLGAARDTVDSVRVAWPDGRVSVVRRPLANQRLTVRQAEAVAAPPAAPARAAPTTLRALALPRGLDFVHHENDFVDFDRDPLLPKMLSTEGPPLAVADVNGDGLDDIFLGGAKEQAGALYLQRRDGSFARSNPGLFEADAISEDVGAVFFDANGDGHPDLYVVSGGNEFSDGAPALQDRLYLNDGHGKFHKAIGALPDETTSGSRAVAADYDGDGDQDLFVGGRLVPWQYGASPAPRSMLLRNDGRGHFTDVTAQLAPELEHVGMVTDAVWADVDGDGRLDLVVVGEWMPIVVFHNAGGGRLVRATSPGLATTHGWWNRVVAGDFTGHGRVDLVVGNLGLNTRLHASEREPATMLVKDFDGNGMVEQLVATYEGGTPYPIALRDDLLRALPFLAPRFPTYESYARKRVSDIFTPQELTGAVVDTVQTFATSLVRNEGGGRFTVLPLPAEAQLAPVYALMARDVDGDGTLDVLLAGNLDGVKPELGRMAAGRGLLLRGDGAGALRPVPGAASGFVVPGQARDIQRVRTAAGAVYVVARNGDAPLVFRGR